MKKILIYGMGKTGIELKKFCKRNSISFCTFDDKTDNQSDFIKLLEKCSYIVVSPGIGLRNKNLKIAINKKIKIISEIEFASKFLDKPIIAITGTNGKTTTVMLTNELLTSAGVKVFLGGNIGTPLIKAVNSKEKLKTEDLKNVKSFCILIGPEGDFSQVERELILQNRAVKPFTLSRNILRSDTAVISAISLVNFINNFH